MDREEGNFEWETLQCSWVFRRLFPSLLLIIVHFVVFLMNFGTFLTCVPYFQYSMLFFFRSFFVYFVFISMNFACDVKSHQAAATPKVYVYVTMVCTFNIVFALLHFFYPISFLLLFAQNDAGKRTSSGFMFRFIVQWFGNEEHDNNDCNITFILH